MQLNPKNSNNKNEITRVKLHLPKCQQQKQWPAKSDTHTHTLTNEQK